MDKIQEIKERYGQSAEDIIASGLNLQKVGKKYRCPNHYAHNNGDRDPSMSWDNKALQFYCFGCGHKIDLYGYYREHLNYNHIEIVKDLLGEEEYKNTPIKTSSDNFKGEVKKVKPITDECISYINTRGITKDTIDYFNIGTYNNRIAFPYYKYENIVGYKLRKPLKDTGKPKMTSITGSKPYLFNIQNIDLTNKEIVVCEGEFDCMIIHQSGITNVVSVGAGANSLGSMLEQTNDFFKDFESIIVVSDNDDSGNNMDKIMVEHFKDKAKLVDKKLYKYNDINDEHYKFGVDKVNQIVDSARFKIEGRRDLEQTPYQGLSVGEGRYIPTGISQVDYALNDLSPKRLTLVSGRSNGGKTTLIKQIMANAIDKGNKVYLMNGENDAEFLLNEFYQVVIGRDEKLFNKIQINKRTRKEPKKEVLKALQKWHYQKLYMFNKGESKLKTIKELLEMIETEIKFNQYDLIIIDNLMSILSVDALNKNEQQGDFVQALADLSKNYNTHIILVLHPNKTLGKGQEMDFEQISGTSDMYNKADNIIAVNREYDEEIKATGIDGYIDVLKNRYYSELPLIETYFDNETGLILERDNMGNALSYVFNFNKKPIQKEFKEIVLSDDCPF